jgi:mannose/fructose/N-acetylgalactosamine-specific phosphotransferase system component IIC
MTPRQIALKNVTIFFVTAIGSGVAVALAIDFFGLALVGTALAFLMLVYLVKVVYDMEVEKAERLERLNNPRG